MEEHDQAEEIKALLAQWADATDPESLWALRLLKEALEQLERKRESND